jgi:hypothetical protein
MSGKAKVTDSSLLPLGLETSITFPAEIGEGPWNLERTREVFLHTVSDCAWSAFT